MSANPSESADADPPPLQGEALMVYNRNDKQKWNIIIIQGRVG